MALTDDQKLGYIVPLVVYGSLDLDNQLMNLTNQLQSDAQAAFDAAIPGIQSQVESLIGHPLTPAQVTTVRTLIAGKLNPALEAIRISP